MNTNDQLQTHIPDPSLLRVRAVNTQGNTVIGYLVCFQQLTFLTLPTDKSKGFSVR